ncbi:carbohydrate porin [Escherichia coli]
MKKFSINHVLTRGSADDITDYTDKNADAVAGRPRTVPVYRLRAPDWRSWRFLSEKTATTMAPATNRRVKYTIALGPADGPDFMSRPELRIFASYLNDSEDGKPFEDQTANNTRNFGVQVEARW